MGWFPCSGRTKKKPKKDHNNKHLDQISSTPGIYPNSTLTCISSFLEH